MIISRTPFRISFFGGGTDYPVWYRKNGGAVLSTTINKYCYISCRYLPPFFDHKYLMRYRLREEVNGIDEIQHPSVRECLRFLGWQQGMEMVHTSDLPARSGVGSSSAFTVGFLNAMYALDGKMVGKRRLASEAIHVEQDIIRENVGSQDQVAAAFGGLNRVEFNAQEDFVVQPITVNHQRLDQLQQHLMLFFTGFSRTASEIACEQIENTHNKEAELRAMHAMVDEATVILNSQHTDIEEFGRLMHESWCLKRTLSRKVTTEPINQMYDAAMKAGALGGKLCGAGGGGFLLMFVAPDKQELVRRALSNLLYVPFKFENLGTQITYYAPEQPYNEAVSDGSTVEAVAQTGRKPQVVKV